LPLKIREETEGTRFEVKKLAFWTTLYLKNRIFVACEQVIGGKILNKTYYEKYSAKNNKKCIKMLCFVKKI
jgi:hypothetical protein